MNKGTVPSNWRQANVVPAFKKSQKYLCCNYRPISMTCVVSKVMEHVVCGNIMSHADTHSILYPLQHGFHSRRSCETQLIEFVHDVVTNMSAGIQTDICVLDFVKAFNKVGHRRLIAKLRCYGVEGDTNQSIQGFLSNRKQRVVVEGTASEELDVSLGVLQGSVHLVMFYKIHHKLMEVNMPLNWKLHV